MKIFLTIFLSLSLLLVGLAFLSPRSIEEDKNTGDNFINKIRDEDYSAQYKRRDFVRERRSEKHEVLKGYRNDKQKTARSRHDDFIVFDNDGSSRSRYDDFR